MQTCSMHAPCRSAFTGNTRAFRPISRASVMQSSHHVRRFVVRANVDTGYKKAGDGAKKSTVEDQLHEAEADKNASAFVKEFKEDLGATGERKTADDKKDVQEREDDKVGLKRAENDAKREQESKK